MVSGVMSVTSAPRRKRCVRVGGLRRFAAEHAHAAIEAVGGDRGAREQPAARHRGDHRIEGPGLLEQLQRGGALPGDHARVVVGMDQLGAGLVLHRGAGGGARRQGRFAQDHARAVLADRAPA